MRKGYRAAQTHARLGPWTVDVERRWSARVASTTTTCPVCGKTVAAREDGSPAGHSIELGKRGSGNRGAHCEGGRAQPQDPRYVYEETDLVCEFVTASGRKCLETFRTLRGLRQHTTREHRSTED